MKGKADLPALAANRSPVATVRSGTLIARGMRAIAQYRGVERENHGQDERYHWARAIYQQQRNNTGKAAWTLEECATLTAAFKTMRQLAREGYGRAFFPLAYFYGAGWPIPYDSESDRVYGDLGIEDPPRSGYGQLKNDVLSKRFEKTAFAWLFAAKEQEDAELWFDLGCCYLRGNAVETDELQAACWLLKSAERGFAEAQFTFGVLCDRRLRVNVMTPMTPSAVLAAVVGNVPLPRTEVTKKIWDYIKENKLQDSINKRLINADEKLRQVFGGKKQVSMFEMTKLVSNHLRQSDTEAVFWYRQAAEKGHAAAQCALGQHYDVGISVPQNDAEAAKWYRKAADQGVADAQCRLGDMYFTGRGVPRDHAEAAKWYCEAAGQGQAEVPRRFAALGIDLKAP